MMLLANICMAAAIVILAPSYVWASNEQQPRSIFRRRENSNILTTTTSRHDGSMQQNEAAATFETFQHVTTTTPMQQQQHEVNYGAVSQGDNDNDSAFSGNLFLMTSKKTSFDIVVYITLANIAMGSLSLISQGLPWQLRVPRLLWDICLMGAARMATYSTPTLPGLTLLLALMLACTACTDLLFWAPTYALLSLINPNQLVETVQSATVGMIYFVASVAAWGAFTTAREEQKLDRQVRAMQQYEQQNSGGRLLVKPIRKQ